MQLSAQLVILLQASVAYSHMYMSSPAPRHSKELKNYKGPVDYDMSSPLGGRFTFPCRGYLPDITSAKFQAGSNIPVKLAGGAMHNGGHCQFSISYDGKNFAVLKTVMGNCLTGGLNYDVPIPKDAPNGKATFAWSWINRTGNREYYMNCADIEIEGGNSQGKITGPKMLVANLPGYTTFPEGFKDDYGKEMFDSQPMVSVSPSGSNIDNNPKPQPSDKPTQVDPKPQPTSYPEPTYNPNPKPEPTSKPMPMPTYNPNPKPIPNPSQCKDGKMYCVGNKSIAMCFMNTSYTYQCPRGTKCRDYPDSARCV